MVTVAVQYGDEPVRDPPQLQDRRLRSHFTDGSWTHREGTQRDTEQLKFPAPLVD